MESRHKILILDDDAAVLEVYKQWLSQMPSKPEIHTANTGSRAIALLEAEPFRLLISDLKMPKMDGLQVLAIVRRRFPELRTVVITGLQDEEYRSRAYGLGVDLFWLKPDTQQNMQMFLECIEALLGKDNDVGFRGVQSKSLMDIIQMECLSQGSLLLRVTNGSLVGKIWIQNGDLVDAETEGARGEAAFRRILEWKSGTFENLPADLNRPRSIEKSINALLLETAQAIDETAGGASPEGPGAEQAEHKRTVRRLAALTRAGAEWIVSIPPQGSGDPEGWGTEATSELAAWSRHAGDICKRLTEGMQAGPLNHLKGRYLDRYLVMLPCNEKDFLVSWSAGKENDQIVEKTKQLVASWG